MLTYRQAVEGDLDLLADWNRQLIADEGSRNPMNIAQLRERMRGWLAADYRAGIFSRGDGGAEGGEEVAYALFRDDGESLYLRQFFVRRDLRRTGLGRRAMRLLLDEVWPPGRRLTVDVLAGNAAAIAFWRSLSYRDYCLTLERLPGER